MKSTPSMLMETDLKQITHLGKGIAAPYFTPNDKKIIFRVIIILREL